MPEKPDKIIRAIKSGNRAYLGNAGRKGAEVANRNRDIKETLSEIEREEQKLQLLQDELDRLQSTNERIISSDGEDLDFFDDDTYDTYRIGT